MSSAVILAGGSGGNRLGSIGYTMTVGSNAENESKENE